MSPLFAALHAARDRLTPPFAHRHTYEEVAEWFVSEGYEDLELLRDETAPEGVPETYAINVGIRGFRVLGGRERAEAAVPPHVSPEAVPSR